VILKAGEINDDWGKTYVVVLEEGERLVGIRSEKSEGQHCNFRIVVGKPK
jgi:hypothetical protein